MQVCGNILIDSIYKTSLLEFDNNDLITKQYIIDRIEYVKLLPFGVIQTINPILFVKDEFITIAGISVINIFEYSSTTSSYICLDPDLDYTVSKTIDGSQNHILKITRTKIGSSNVIIDYF